VLLDRRRKALSYHLAAITIRRDGQQQMIELARERLLDGEQQTTHTKERLLDLAGEKQAGATHDL